MPYLVLLAVPANNSPGIGPAPGTAVPPVGHAFTLVGSNDIIGRQVLPNQMSATIVLPWLFVSRRHAQIEFNGAGIWEIEDLQSRNGTCVNRQVLQPHTRLPLTVGDRIGIGPNFCLELEFRDQLQSPAGVPLPEVGEAAHRDDGADESITVTALTR
jgi:hypothetical protein